MIINPIQFPIWGLTGVPIFQLEHPSWAPWFAQSIFPHGVSKSWKHIIKISKFHPRFPGLLNDLKRNFQKIIIKKCGDEKPFFLRHLTIWILKEIRMHIDQRQCNGIRLNKLLRDTAKSWRRQCTLLHYTFRLITYISESGGQTRRDGSAISLHGKCCSTYIPD